VSVREEQAAYRLAGRRTGSALFGLSATQLVLACSGAVAVVLTLTRTGSGWGLAAGLMIAAVCAALAFCPMGGRPLYEALSPVTSFAIRQVARRRRWAAPLPLLTGTAPKASRREEGGSRALPRCLSGLELLPVDRPGWAGGAGLLAPVGLVRDARAGTLTAVVEVRGGQFSLLDAGARHQRLADWALVLSQFAREASPVSRLGWSLWSAPAPLAEHLDWLDGHLTPAALNGTGGGPTGQGLAEAVAGYRRLVDAAAPVVSRHDLRVWITVDPRRLAGGHGRAPDPPAAALAAMKALSDRCRAAGLVVSPPLSPVQIAEAMRAQADPSVVAAMARVRRGLAEHAGLASVLHALDRSDAGGAVHPVHAGPMAVDTRWDAVRVDGAWHPGVLGRAMAGAGAGPALARAAAARPAVRAHPGGGDGAGLAARVTTADQLRVGVHRGPTAPAGAARLPSPGPPATRPRGGRRAGSRAARRVLRVRLSRSALGDRTG
jgi:hypothetical protein